MYIDLELLLTIGCVETNPGPHNITQHNAKPQQLNTLNICHININSITAPGRLDELCQFVSTHSVDILALTETKLDESIHQSLYKIDNYHPPFTRHRNRHGGGVAIYTRTNLPTMRLDGLETDGEEWIWTKTKVDNNVILTCCLYLPPNLTSDRLDHFINRFTDSVSLAQAYSPATIIITGDFNAGNAFLQDQTINHSGITHFDIKLRDALYTLNLSQIISTPTRQTQLTANLRDLMITNNPLIIADSGTLSSFSNIDHFPVFASIRIQTPKTSVTTKKIWDYDKLDADKLTRLLLHINWDNIIEQDIHIATEKFTHTILTAAAEAIPIKTIHIRPTNKPWITADLKRNIRRRDRLFTRAKQRQTDRDWDKWKQQRNFVTDLNRRLRNAHLKMQVNKLLGSKLNPHQYHQTLKNIMGRTKNQTIPPLETVDGETVTDNTQKANILNDFFVSQTQLHTDALSLPEETPNIRQIPFLEDIKVTEVEVLKLLNNLDVNKSTGSDNLPTKIIKLTAIIILEPLCRLFNKSLRMGLFPLTWKEATVTPIFKNKGSASDPENYRPISLLPCLSKILEKIVFNRIYEHSITHHLLTEKQSGYRPHHCTQLQLMYLTHNLYKSLDGGRDMTAVFLDISKYFDKIWHEGLIFKCKNEFFISGSLLSWLNSYLTDRRQKVRIEDAHSNTLTLNAGCPQGSVLGPLLALIYLNGLADLTTNDILFYADDTSIYTTHKNDDIHTATETLQRDLDTIYKYGKTWAITFSAAKTAQITFTNKVNSLSPALTFAQQPIPKTTTHKHLGLTLSQDLRFHEHINTVIRKVNIALSPLYPVAQQLPRQVLNIIYKTYIQPYFDYCDTIYDGHLTVHDELRLERLQNRAARLVTGTPFRTSTNKLREELGWDSLKTRRKIHRLTFYRRLYHTQDMIPSYIQNILPQTRHSDTGQTLRNANTNTTTFSKTSSFHRSFIPDTTNKWNLLPEILRSEPSQKMFKKQISELYGIPYPSEFYSFGYKAGNVNHTKIRCGSFELNSYLYQIQKSSTPACACGFHLEDSAHFVLHCPTYCKIRDDCFNDISAILNYNFSTLRPPEKLKILLHGSTLDTGSGRRVAWHFQNYLQEAKQLR